MVLKNKTFSIRSLLTLDILHPYGVEYYKTLFVFPRVTLICKSLLVQMRMNMTTFNKCKKQLLIFQKSKKLNLSVIYLQEMKKTAIYLWEMQETVIYI